MCLGRLVTVAGSTQLTVVAGLARPISGVARHLGLIARTPLRSPLS